MKHRFVLVAAASAAMLFASPAARSAEADPDHATQQTRFAACAHESKGLKGEDHTAFMSDCLKGSAEGEAHHKEHASQRASSEPGSQQSKMKSCNEEAGRKALHGDERRAFMSTCLKG
jgi:psiF repeat